VFAGGEHNVGIELAEAMRQAVFDLDITHIGNSPYGRVTISSGIASVDSDAELNKVEIFELADQALYRAKGAGRNTVAC